MAGAAPGDRLLTLGVDGQRFAVPSGIVREVARLPRLARVPHAPAALMGLANIRGAVVPVLSLATLVERHSTGERRVVIVNDGEVVGLAVDDVSQMIGADEAAEASVRTLDIAALIAKFSPNGGERRTRGAGLVEAQDAELRADTVPLVIFAIGSQEFALPIGVVEEVLRLPEDIARMPRADAAVVGSTALRGALLPLLSLRALLALPGADDAARGRMLVVRIGANRVGLVVDAMRSILRVPEGDIDAVPQVLARGGAEARIQAICRLEGGKRLVSVLAADQLLRDDITARLFQGAGEQQDMGEAASTQKFEQFLLFRIGEEEFGLPIGAVEEVALLPAKLTRLPRAPAFVQGVMNLRGQVIPVIDQAQRFGAGAASGRKRRAVIVRIGDLSAGFVVDSVSDVLQIEASALRPAPDLGNEETRVFDRVANLAGEERIVLIVSPRELLDRAEQDLLRSIAGEGATPAP
ncbi:chemotaxis protein CheW [Sphingomonas sp. LM7]|nr:chemotaxis protein CheW [Sphingomonas sp. LM7]